MDKDDKDMFSAFVNRNVTGSQSTVHPRTFKWMTAAYDADTSFPRGIDVIDSPDLEEFEMIHDSGRPNIDEAVEAERDDRRHDFMEYNQEYYPDESEQYHRNTSEQGVKAGPTIDGIGSLQDFGKLVVIFRRDQYGILYPNGHGDVSEDDPIVDYITKFVKPLDLDVI